MCICMDLCAEACGCRPLKKKKEKKRRKGIGVVLFVFDTPGNGDETGACLSMSLPSSDPSEDTGSPCPSRCSSPPQQLHRTSASAPVTSCFLSSCDPHSGSSPQQGRARKAKVGSAPATGHPQAPTAAASPAWASKRECPWATGSAGSRCCSGLVWWDSTWLECRIPHSPIPHPRAETNTNTHKQGDDNSLVTTLRSG